MQRLSQQGARQYHSQITRGIYLLCHQSLSQSRKSITTSQRVWRGRNRPQISGPRYQRYASSAPGGRKSSVQYELGDHDAKELKTLEDPDEKESKTLDDPDAEEEEGGSEDLEGSDILKELGLEGLEELEELSGIDIEKLAGLEDVDLQEIAGLADLDAADEEGLEALNTTKYGHLEDAESRQLRERILELENELTEMRSGKSLSWLSKEDREKLKLTQKGANVDSQEGLAKETSPSPAPAEKVEESPLRPRWHEVKLQDFMKCLAGAAIDPSNLGAAQSLWRSYISCKHSIPRFFQVIPDGAWDVLWESQHKAQRASRDTARHLGSLLDDMLQCQRPLTPTQTLVYIEWLYTERRYAEAIRTWWQHEPRLRKIDETAEYFEDLCVRIYAAAGNPQKAQDLAFGFLTSRDKAGARILTPVIKAWAKLGDDTSIQNAWAAYLRLRIILGSSITLEDYNHIATCFLDIGRADMALAVFKDLMLAGQNSQYDSTELYKTSLGLLDELRSQSVDVQDLTKVSLTALTVLPRRFQNRFFFASWLKQLLGMGKIGSAFSVLELMIERGVNPDPKHLNGIMAALIRSGKTRDEDKAVQMGLAMIEERLKAVSRRRGGAATGEDAKNLEVLKPDIRRLPHLRRIYIPPATIETFSILLLYFQRRSMLGSIERLKKSLRAAEIYPNAYFMNHLIYAQLRQGEYHEAWDVYTKMTVKIKPDLQTFASLWDCKKAHLDHSAVHPGEMFADSRHIFSDMMNWFSKQPHVVRKETRQEFNKDLYMQVVRCFCLAKDIQGTLVALHAMKESFGLYPDENTARMVALQVSRLGETKSTVKRRQRNQIKDNIVANVKKVSQVLKILAEERDEALRAVGISQEGMSEEQLAQESLFRLTQLLRTVLRGSGLSNEGLEEAIEHVAWEMCSGGLRMDDPMLPPRDVERTEGVGDGELVAIHV
ncbi:hypothetical protein MMC30_000059 [Trapelia coarctata]|nr:hypothetical protein [Trapelia coarctata]